jgi:hypothetical protein
MNAADGTRFASGSIPSRRAWSWLILLACSFLGPALALGAETSSLFANSPCLTASPAAPADQCERLAREVSHDIRMARALGDELERAGRYQDAVKAYQIALTVHPKHRDLLQGLIRARGLTRSAALLTPAATAIAQAQPATPPATPPLTPPKRTEPPSPANVPKPPPEPKQTLPPPPIEERYYALIIANEAYRNFTPLRSPLADAHAMAAILGRDYGFIVSTLQNATRYEMLSALSRLRREAGENDHVLIYYAGHGYLDETTSRGYWLPVDAERDNVANWVSTNDITDVLAGLQARHALILADSCFSGTLLRSTPAIEIDERQSLLRKLASRRSRSIMTSGGLEPVIDGGAGKHSVFASALLRALGSNKQPIEAGRLFVQIRDRVALNAEQTPQYAPLRNAGHDGGDFIFQPRKR